MRKVLLATLGIIAAITFLSSLGNLFGLAVSAAIIFTALHFYLKAHSTATKIFWAIIGILGAISAISNIPALIGLVALAAVYWVYKKWNSDQPVFKKTQHSNDPFTNFEKQWNDIQK